jgi:hypothetical protein
VVPNHVDVPRGERRTFRDSLVGVTPAVLKTLPDRDLAAGDLP